MKRPPFLAVIAGKRGFRLEKTPHGAQYSLRHERQRFALGGGDLASLVKRWNTGTFDWAMA